jgi:hypothetical protein
MRYNLVKTILFCLRSFRVPQKAYKKQLQIATGKPIRELPGHSLNYNIRGGFMKKLIIGRLCISLISNDHFGYL